MATDRFGPPAVLKRHTLPVPESEVIRTGELQAWFLAEHLVDTPLVRTD